MRTFAALLLLAAAADAQNVTASLYDSSTQTTSPLSSAFQFADTPVGSASPIVVRIQNSGPNPVSIAAVFVGAAPGSSTQNQQFTVVGAAVGKILSNSALSFEQVEISFAPTAQGPVTGYLEVVYSVVQNGCSLTSSDPSTACVSQILALSTMTGNATAPQLVLSYAGPNGSTVLQPNTASPLGFGNVSTSSSQAITFTLANQTSTALPTPAISIQNPVFASSAFALSPSTLPGAVPANGSINFVVTFAPGQVGLTSATLLVGSLSYPIAGAGAIVQSLDALSIYYVDSTGVRSEPQAATPISFGQSVAGAGTPVTLAFTVTNPQTSLGSITVPALTVSGSAFSLSNAPSMPAAIAPGQSITFNISFSASTLGNYTGTLSIGSRLFNLTGSVITSALPQPAIQVSMNPLTSQQQPTVTVALASASTITAVGTLTMTFTPSVANVADDPSILFISTGTRSLQVSVAPGATQATYNGVVSIPFQTGTTAGTITFTVAFPNQAPVSQSFTITDAKIVITNAKAVRQDPNLVVTITGYDNTYSAGKLAFTFYDTGGNSMTPSAISVDATSAFSQYFFNNDPAGGAFSVQATFPVTGAVSSVGSVSIQIANAIGTTTTSETFQ